MIRCCSVIRGDVLRFDEIDSPTILSRVQITDGDLQTLVDSVTGLSQISAWIRVDTREGVDLVLRGHAGLVTIESGVVEIGTTDSESRSVRANASTSAEVV